jgi:hypothetical protein
MRTRQLASFAEQEMRKVKASKVVSGDGKER